MAFSSVLALLQASEHKPLWQAVLDDDIADRGVRQEESWTKMASLWAAMRASVRDYDPGRRSLSGLSGGDGGKYEAAAPGYFDAFAREVVATALKVGECNACMRRIVAAPTAGSGGVLPAVLLPAQNKLNLPDETMVRALYVAAGFGQVIAARATISGAEGGCQAEIGSASAMAAAALVFIKNGSPHSMADACATALQNVLGLVCDPVGGLVEVPCIKRNVMGALNAVAAAEMALAGVGSFIPCDEVIDAMRAVGDALPASLRETGRAAWRLRRPRRT
jgi:L-serine dehydratase